MSFGPIQRAYSEPTKTPEPMRGTLPNTDQPRIPHSEYCDIWRRRQDTNEGRLLLVYRRYIPFLELSRLYAPS